MKKTFFAAAAVLFATALTAHLPAEQLTQIGVIDMSRIISSYFEASYSLREINEMTTRFENDKAQIVAKIQSLQTQQVAAQNSGDEQQALQIAQEIDSQRSYLTEFIRVRTNEINAKRDTLLQSPTFLSNLVQAIAYVAQNNGYSIVLRSDDPSILYWNKEVDITDLVINQLKQMHSSGSS